MDRSFLPLARRHSPFDFGNSNKLSQNHQANSSARCPALISFVLLLSAIQSVAPLSRLSHPIQHG
jgi:hypothetical protein